MKPFHPFFADNENPNQWSVQNVSSAVAFLFGVLVTGLYVYGAFLMDGRTPVSFWQWLVGVAFFFSLSAWFKAGMGDTGFKEILDIIKGVVK